MDPPVITALNTPHTVAEVHVSAIETRWHQALRDYDRAADLHRDWRSRLTRPID